MNDQNRASFFTTHAALEYFELDRQLLGRVLSAGLSRGADACELFFQRRRSVSLNLSGHAVRKGGVSIIRGVGVRVIKDGRTGYSHTADLSETGMAEAARVASMIAEGFAGPRTVEATRHIADDVRTIDVRNGHTKKLYEESTDDFDVGHARAWLESIDAQCHSLDSRVSRAIVFIQSASERVLVVNSNGRMASDDRPLFMAYAGCVAESGGRTEENMESFGIRKNPRAVMTSETAERLARGAVRGTVSLFDAVESPSGEMPLVLAPGGGGILLHEAMGHGFEADFIRKGTSIFAGKLGEKVAGTDVTIVDSGLENESFGSLHIDDEGAVSRETTLVEEGRLSSWLHDGVSASYFGVEPTGNGRREDYRHAPLPRMRCTFMRPGPHSPEEIIGSVKRGIYAERFSNGEVDIGPGDFSFYVKSGFLIENGKLGAPVKDVNLIGNGPAALAEVEMVGNDLAFDEGCNYCGKYGQSVPVGMGTPTLKIRAITVGGRA